MALKRTVRCIISSSKLCARKLCAGLLEFFGTSFNLLVGPWSNFAKSPVHACRLWAISRHLHCTSPCPLYPRKRTLRALSDCQLRAKKRYSRSEEHTSELQ